MLKRLGFGLLLGGALASVAAAQGSAKFDGQYMGQLTLTQIVSGDCTQPPEGSLYPLTIARGEVRFAYTPRFDTRLVGRVADNGMFEASARSRNGVVRMSGYIRADQITATIVSPSCNYTFQTRN